MTPKSINNEFSCGLLARSLNSAELWHHKALPTTSIHPHSFGMAKPYLPSRYVCTALAWQRHSYHHRYVCTALTQQSHSYRHRYVHTTLTRQSHSYCLWYVRTALARQSHSYHPNTSAQLWHGKAIATVIDTSAQLWHGKAIVTISDTSTQLRGHDKALASQIHSLDFVCAKAWQTLAMVSLSVHLVCSTMTWLSLSRQLTRFYMTKLPTLTLTTTFQQCSIQSTYDVLYGLP